MQVSVHGNLRIAGALVFDNKTNQFPANPDLGTLCIKEDMLYAYMSILGTTAWYPLIQLPERYVHTQLYPADTWTVTHNLNKTDVWYQIQDTNGVVMQPSGFTKVDDNTITLSFSEPVFGKALVLGTGVDSPIEVGGGGSSAWADITDTPTTLSGYGITDAAPLASPALTGTPTAPTAAAKDATTQIATDAFVDRLRSFLTGITTGTPTTADRGCLLLVTAGIELPASVFAAGDTFSIYNDSASSITLTQGSGLTLRLGGTATTGNRTLAQRGIATVVFISATEAVIGGMGLM